MNHYLPPQARLQASTSCTHDAQRVQMWNPARISPPAPVASSPYYTRNAATPGLAQMMNTQSWRTISPPKPSFPGPKTSPSSSNSNNSVKHLTCYFWAKNGVCKWSDDDCLYAHHNTGKTASGPLQVEPGRFAVAGKNATTARPVYEDWRGGQDSSRTYGTYRHATIEPEIQEQIDYIAAKERARVASQSMSLADARLEEQMGIVTKAMGIMSKVLQQNLADLRDVTSELHTYGFEILQVARALDRENSPHLNQLTAIAQGVIGIMSTASNAEAVIQETKESLMKDLEGVGLTSFVPAWESASGSAKEGHNTHA